MTPTAFMMVTLDRIDGGGGCLLSSLPAFHPVAVTQFDSRRKDETDGNQNG